MKKTLCFLGAFASTSVMSMDYLKPMYKPAAGGFVGHTNIHIDSNEYSLRNKNTSGTTDYEVSSTRVSQDLKVGLSKSITLLADIDYTMEQKLEASSTEKNSSGIESFNLGASYRVNNLVKLPVQLEAGLKFKPSMKNKKNATTSDDGTVNNGGHDLTILTRTQLAGFYFDLDLVYHTEQTVDGATSGNKEYTVDAYTELEVSAGKQFTPINKLLIDTQFIFTRTGEIKQNLNGGSETHEAHFNYGFDVQAYYSILNNLSANIGVNYMLSPEYEIDAYADQTVQDASALGINLGASYKF